MISPDIKDFWISWAALLLEGTPFLFLGSMLAAGVTLFLPIEKMLTRVPTSRPLRLAYGVIAGIILPLCECASILVVRRLMKRGLPFDVAFIYFLSGAMLNPITLFTTHTAFLNRHPLEMTLMRFGFGLLLIIGLGIWISFQDSSQILKPNPHLHEHDHHASSKFSMWQNDSLHDFFLMLPYYVVGSAAAAFFNTVVPWKIIAPFMENPWLSPLLAILLAQGMSLCSTIDAFVIAPFFTIPIHAKIAFLISGPLFDFKLLAMYLLLFRGRWIFKFWVAVVLGSLLLSWIQWRLFL